MIDGNVVVAQAQQGSVPPVWQVLRAKTSFFYQHAALGMLGLLIGAGVFLYLVLNPNTAFERGSDTTTASGISLWRNIDFVVLSVIALVSIYVLLKNLAESANADQQVLVIMPEGFVISTDKIQTYAFSNIHHIAITLNSRGAATIKLTPLSGSLVIHVHLDKRFGDTEQIAQNILAAREHFTAAQVAAQQPPADR